MTVKMPNYKVLRYEFDNISSNMSRMTSYFRPLLLRYNPNYLTDFMKWLGQYNDQQLLDIGLRINEDEDSILWSSRGAKLILRTPDGLLRVSSIVIPQRF